MEDKSNMNSIKFETNCKFRQFWISIISLANKPFQTNKTDTQRNESDNEWTNQNT